MYRLSACTISNSSPIAPPVLKSSSMSPRNCSRCSAISLSRAESPGSRSPRAGGCRELVETFAGQLGESFKRPIERLQAAIDLVEPVRAEVDRPAVMAREQQGAERVRVVGFEQVAHQHDRAGVGLGDLPPLLGEQAVVHPVRGERLAGVRLGLGQLVLVVREDQVEPAAVDVEVARRGSFMLMAEHSMCQPGRPGPQGLSQAGSPGLELFHRAKSPGLRLIADGSMRAPACSCFRVAVAELAVIGVLGDVEVDVAGRCVGEPLVDRAPASIAMISAMCSVARGMWSMPSTSERCQAVEVVAPSSRSASSLTGRAVFLAPATISLSSTSVMLTTHVT